MGLVGNRLHTHAHMSIMGSVPRIPNNTFHGSSCQQQLEAQAEDTSPKFLEEALGRFTHQKLKTLSTWSKWHDGECQQLDHFHSLGMYGSPVKHPEGAIIL